MSPVLHSGLPPTSVDTQAVAFTYATWTQKSAAVHSEITAYFPDHQIPLHWDNLAGLIHNFYLLTYATDLSMRQYYIGELQKYFDFHRVNIGVDWNALMPYQPSLDTYRKAWVKLERAILHVRDVLEREIMDSEAPTF